MRVQTRIQKWGNGLALRVSGAMRDLPQFQAGTEVEVEVTEEGFVVRRAMPNTRLPFSEAELLRDITPEKAHAEALAEPTSREWGD